MQFDRVAALLLVSSLLVLPCLSLPTNEQRQAGPQPTGRRATYSVVPIDGGSGPGRSGGSEGSGGSDTNLGPGHGGPGRDPVTVTVTKTLSQETSFKTIYYFTPRPTTEHVTETVIVTKTIRVVDISPALISPTTTNTRNTTSMPSVGGIDSSSMPQTTMPPPASTAPTSSSAKGPAQTGSSGSWASTSVTSTSGDSNWHTSHPFRNDTSWHQVHRERRRLRQFV